MGEIKMTLRESSQSYVDNFVNHFNNGTIFRISEYSSKSWNVLYNKAAREYILEKLNQTLICYNFHFSYFEDDSSYYLVKTHKILLMTPISSLTLDEEFTWDKVSLC